MRLFFEKLITRRDFLKTCGWLAVSGVVMSRLTRFAHGQEAKLGFIKPVLAMHYEKLPNQRVKCLLCPRNCIVAEGHRGFCRVRENRDGIDIDSCRGVRIANCHVHTGDDAIVLKATAPRTCEHVTVTNCVLSSQASAFKLGTESNGGFEDITCSNCTIYDTGYSGIGLMMVDGARLARVNVSNITMKLLFISTPYSGSPDQW